jgi:hypothetical protein
MPTIIAQPGNNPHADPDLAARQREPATPGRRP